MLCKRGLSNVILHTVDVGVCYLMMDHEILSTYNNIIIFTLEITLPPLRSVSTYIATYQNFTFRKRAWNKMRSQ